MIVFGVLTLLFGMLFVHDVVQHSWGRAVLGAIVVALSVTALVREWRPSSASTERPPAGQER